MQVRGEVDFWVRREGEVIYHGKEKNLVVDSGVQSIVNILGFVAASRAAQYERPDQMKLGDSGTAVSAGQTDIQGAEVATKAITYPADVVVATTFIQYLVNHENTVAAGYGVGTWSVAEMALFGAGTMWARFTTDTFPVNVDDSVTVGWGLYFAGAY